MTLEKGRPALLNQTETGSSVGLMADNCPGPHMPGQGMPMPNTLPAPSPNRMPPGVVFNPTPLTDADFIGDPWAHRSRKMHCVTCMWYVMKANHGLNELGRCRKRSPTMDGYPVVFATDWCGDHKLDENK